MIILTLEKMSLNLVISSSPPLLTQCNHLLGLQISKKMFANLLNHPTTCKVNNHNYSQFDLELFNT